MYEAISADRIGQRIKGLRLQKKMSMEQMAKTLGTSYSAISMYENGERIPRDEIKIKIAELFGVSVETIFFQKQ